MPNTATFWTTEELISVLGVSKQQISNIANQRGWQRVTGYTGDIEQYLEERNVIENRYKIGDTIEVPHPYTNKMESAEIINFSRDTVNHPQTRSATGLMVKFDDGIIIEVDRNFLEQ